MDDAIRGQKAEQLKDNPLLEEIWSALRADYLLKWETTAPGDTQARENLWRAVTVLNQVKSQVENYAASGRLAGKEAERIARLGKRTIF